MARDIVVEESRSGHRSVVRPARVRGPWLLGLALALGVGAAEDARASGIFRGLTPQDRSQPILLSATGQEITLSSGDAAAALAAGKVPAYLAFPLDGGEHIPSGTPTITTGPESAAGAVGPLALTPTVQATLNTDLLASNGAIVDAPAGSYAVAILPRYAEALAQATSSSTTTGDTSPTSVLESMFGISPKANWTILGLSTSEISKWLKSGSSEISHLTSAGASGVSKTLGVKVSSTSNGLVVAPQFLSPPTSPDRPAESESVIAPEPGGWLVFGLLAGAAGLRRLADRGRSPRGDGTSIAN